jgi:putative endonuclease
MNTARKNSISTTQKGQAAENAALFYLEQQGLRLVERNFSTRLGEIDLIMWQQQTLVFIEVRQLSNPHFGGAVASISLAKQDKLWNTAQIYLQRFAALPACRFDLLAINGLEMAWLKNFISR